MNRFTLSLVVILLVILFAPRKSHTPPTRTMGMVDTALCEAWGPLSNRRTAHKLGAPVR